MSLINNTVELQEILQMVNDLPESGGGNIIRFIVKNLSQYGSYKITLYAFENTTFMEWNDTVFNYTPYGNVADNDFRLIHVYENRVNESISEGLGIYKNGILVKGTDTIEADAIYESVFDD